MKKIILAFSSLLLLASCATFTLVTVNLDAASFVPASFRSGEFTAIPIGGSIRLPSDTGDLISNVAQLNVIEKGNINLALTFTPNAANQAVMSLILDFFIGPATAPDVFLDSYKIVNMPVIVNPNANKAVSLAVALDANSSDSKIRDALTALKSGSFRYGLRIQVSPGTGEKLNYQLDKFDISVAGYPIKLVK